MDYDRIDHIQARLEAVKSGQFEHIPLSWYIDDVSDLLSEVESLIEEIVQSN